VELVLVRHTTLAIESGICYGQADVLPSDTFVDEAELVAKNLVDVKPDQIYTSPLRRCTLLANACGFSNALHETRLLELDFGEWELVPWSAINDEYAQQWMNNYISIPTPNGESLQDMVRRVQFFIAEIRVQKYAHVLCFTHSGVIRIMEHLVNAVPLDKLFDTPIAYGGVYRFKV
jgi:alpha-ribazole phosphatase